MAGIAGATDGSGGCLSGMYGTIGCGGSIGSITPGTSPNQPVAAIPGAPATTIPAANIIYTPSVAPGANGRLCVTFTQMIGPNLVNTIGNQTDLLSLKLLQTYGLCPAAPIPPTIATNPVVLAQQFWQTIPLPVPRPAVPPGFAVTGKPTYLVTHGTTTPPSWTDPTPLGPLTVTAHGSYTVDWGDGTTTGPYDTESFPYPNGTISHTYDNVATVALTLTESWTATWSLGPAGGTLQQLQTVGRIPVLPIEQIQAVITH